MHFRQIGQLSRPTCVMHNARHITYLQALAVCCAVLSPLTGCSVFPVLAAVSAQDVGVDMDAVSCNLRRIRHS